MVRVIALLLLGSSPGWAADQVPSSLTLQLPLPCGSKAYIYCGYLGQGGTYGYCPLHTGADAYALDFTYYSPTYSPTNGLGQPVTAVASGAVAAAGTLGGYGLTVLVAHTTPDGIYHSLYAHLQSITVQQGQQVATGEVVGKLGMSGGANGIAHLHFVFRKGGDAYSGQAVMPEPMSGQSGFRAESSYQVTCAAPPPPDAGPPPADGQIFALDGTAAGDTDSGSQHPDTSGVLEFGTRPNLSGSCALGGQGAELPLWFLLFAGLLRLRTGRRGRPEVNRSRRRP